MFNPDSFDSPQPKPSHAYEHYLTWGILALIGLEIGLAIAYLSTSLINGQSPEFLDFNGLRTLPSLIQAAQLFLIAAIAFALLLFKRQLNHKLSWPLLCCLTVLCIFGGLDEVLKIHLTFKQFNWKGIYLGILTAVPILCWSDLIRLWRSHRDIVLWVAAGISVFLLGGFGAEFLKSGLTSLVTGRDAGSIVFGLEQIRITVEELAELLGETLIVYGMGQFVIRFI